MIHKKMIQRRFTDVFLQVLLLSTVLFLTSCTTTLDKIALNPTSGFGGTGNGPTSGFGGTGIVGTVTDFGSIWVNGLEVEYANDTKVTSNLSRVDTLELGKQLVFETLEKSDHLKTLKISIYYPIAGKITGINGQELIINNEYFVNIYNAKLDAKAQLNVGKFVAVNGFKVSSNKWFATRVNDNPLHKVFYQPIPKLAFSSAVKHVLIETSRQQLKQWKALESGLDKLSKNQDRILVVGTYKNSYIEINSINAYSASHSKQNPARNTLERLKQSSFKVKAQGVDSFSGKASSRRGFSDTVGNHGSSHGSSGGMGGGSGGMGGGSGGFGR